MNASSRYTSSEIGDFVNNIESVSGGHSEGKNVHGDHGGLPRLLGAPLPRHVIQVRLLSGFEASVCYN